MRVRQIDIYISDPTGIGYVFVTDVEGGDLVKLTIDKQPRGSPFPGVVSHASLTEAQALKLRNALDAWLRRNDPRVPSGCEIVNEPSR